MNHLITSIHSVKEGHAARLALILALVLALCLPGQAFAAGGGGGSASAPTLAQVNALVDQVAAYEVNQLTQVKGGPGYGYEWAVMALARAGKLPDNLKQQYLANLEAYLASNGNVLSSTITDYDRVILALSAIGVNATDVNGVDLTAPLANLDDITAQGANSIVYALLALDSNNYPVPQLAAGASGTQTTRPALVSALLATQLPGGGWNWGYGETAPDPDLTSMALDALAPYYGAGNAQVDAAVDGGLTVLGQIQDDVTAGFVPSWSPDPTSESTAQALTALSSLNIPVTDTRFAKTGGTFYDSLTSFLIDGGSGSKAFVDSAGGVASAMATEQGLYALVAYSRSLAGANRLYDMTDAEPYTGGGATGGGSGSDTGDKGGGASSDKDATKGTGTGSGSGGAVKTAAALPAVTTPAAGLPTTGDSSLQASLITIVTLVSGAVLILAIVATSRKRSGQRAL